MLVVIAIVALLVSILLPALNGAREQAQDTVCLVHVRNIGQTNQLYTADYDDLFVPGWWYRDHRGVLSQTGNPTLLKLVMWQFAARDYWSDPEILLCPKNDDPDLSTISFTTANGGGEFANDETDPWGPAQWMPRLDVLGDKYEEYGPARAGKPVSGYTINDWLGDVGSGDNPDKHWKTMQSKNTAVIPMIADGGWYHGAPLDGAVPMEEQNYKVSFGSLLPQVRTSMNYFAFTRHRGGSNMVFMDMSARQIHIKELWRFKWHREFDRGNPFASANAVWPDWVDNPEKF